MNKKVSSESVVKDIRRRTRKKYSSEEKIRIVLDGLRGEDSIATQSLENIISEETVFLFLQCTAELILEAILVPVRPQRWICYTGTYHNRHSCFCG